MIKQTLIECVYPLKYHGQFLSEKKASSALCIMHYGYQQERIKILRGKSMSWQAII